MKHFVTMSNVIIRLTVTYETTVCLNAVQHVSCRINISATLNRTALFLLHSVFRHLMQLDPDSFWFTLNQIHCPSSYMSPPHPDLRPLQLGGTGQPRDEYSDNVLKLLREEFASDSDQL